MRIARSGAAPWVLMALLGIAAAGNGTAHAQGTPPAATPATQDELATARELLAQANRLYLEEKYQEALPLYERVYRLYPTPNTVFNLAQTHRQLKQYERAIHFYRSYLTLVPRSPKRPEVEKFIAELERLIGEQQRAGDLPPKAPLGAEASPAASVLPGPPAAAATPVIAVTGTGSGPTDAVSRPWYRRWYVWAGVGAAVVGAVVAGVVVGTRGGDIRHLDNRYYFGANP
jgi:tetratricopeptide (TPR) repeat protein